MTAKTKSPYGTWASPLKAEDIAGGTIRLGQVLVDSGSVYWLEGRPKEGGRTVLMRAKPDGTEEELLKAPYNARSLVHEYGGSSFVPDGERAFFTNYSDQRIYCLNLSESGGEPFPVTVEGSYRYADLVVDNKREKIYCVLEDHTVEGKEAQNKIASVDISQLAKGTKVEPVAPQTLADGTDFVAFPRLSHSGDFFTWIAWNHPNMPWDGTKLMLACFDEKGKLQQTRQIAGGEEESIFQPSWSPADQLHYVSDRSGFWNIYKLESDLRDLLSGSIETEAVKSCNLTDMDKEFGMPLWVFNMSTYAFLENGTIICAYSDKGIWKLAKIVEGKFQEIKWTYTDVHYVFSDGKRVAMLAASPQEPSSLVAFCPEKESFTVIKRCAEIELDPGYISRAQVVEFPTTGGKTAYAFYYPPTNKDYEGVEGELPPLLVKSHGGPTGATSTGLNLSFQYWTSRGFGVVDVNYGGSTGYGRDYMKRLEKNWGVVDVDDCENVALHLVSQGKADRKRLAITGGSAGGYTTLCVLTFKDTFSAGASHYGIGDLELLVKDTHKFESRYGDRLVGPYPESKDVYVKRSPLHFTDKLSCPLIVFQGLEDKVVPPNQAESMVEAVKQKGLPVAYIAYEGEQHGFRKAENIKRTIEAEYFFFSTIFGIKPHDQLEAVEITNFKPEKVTTSN